MDLSKNFKDSIALRIETIVMMSPSFDTKEACKIRYNDARNIRRWYLRIYDCVSRNSTKLWSKILGLTVITI